MATAATASSTWSRCERRSATDWRAPDTTAHWDGRRGHKPAGRGQLGRRRRSASHHGGCRGLDPRPTALLLPAPLAPDGKGGPKSLEARHRMTRGCEVRSAAEGCSSPRICQWASASQRLTSSSPLRGGAAVFAGSAGRCRSITSSPRSGEGATRSTTRSLCARTATTRCMAAIRPAGLRALTP